MGTIQTHPYRSTKNKIPYSRGSPEVPITDLYIYILDAILPVHFVSNHADH